MSELDDAFGPKKPAAMPSARRSRFGRYPDVQELCDTFADEMEWKLDGYTIRQIAAGARDFRLAIGNKPELLRRSIKRMQMHKLTIASPRSCITTARKMPSIDTQKYLRGVDDD